MVRVVFARRLDFRRAWHSASVFAVQVSIGSETLNLREGLVQRVGCLAM